MKKIILSLAASFLALYAFSQITVTSSDLPFVGLNLVVVYDTSSHPSVGPSGANQTWDFSYLANEGIDTSKFVDPSATDYASDFPDANLASSNSSNDSVFTFFNTSSTELNALGFAAPTNPFTAGPLIIAFKPDGENLLTLPASYGDSNSGVYKYKIQGPYSYYGADSIRIIHTSNYAWDIDAWGTVVTPYGSYETLRQRNVDHSTDSIAVHINIVGWFDVSQSADTVVNYSWFANDIGFPVVQMSTDATQSTALTVTYVQSTATTVTETHTKAMNLFPNPANEVILLDINNENASSAEVIDALGKVVRNESMKAGVNAISVNQLPAGMYTIILRNKSGGVESVQKVMVQH